MDGLKPAGGDVLIDFRKSYTYFPHCLQVLDFIGFGSLYVFKLQMKLYRVTTSILKMLSHLYGPVNMNTGIAHSGWWNETLSMELWFLDYVIEHNKILSRIQRKVLLNPFADHTVGTVKDDLLHLYIYHHNNFVTAERSNQYIGFISEHSDYLCLEFESLMMQNEITEAVRITKVTISSLL